MKHIPTPGAYRELFKAGLIELLKGNGLSELQRKDAEHYLRLLEDPNYRFGILQSGGGYADFSGARQSACSCRADASPAGSVLLAAMT